VTPGQRRQRSLVALAIASVAFVAVTAAQGSSTISVALPAIDRWIEGLVAIVFEEMIRRVLKKVDAIGRECDRMHQKLERVDVALRGYDGEGGALKDVRELQEEVAALQRAPVAPPPGFSLPSHATQRSGT
jgi:hypothetical protein